MMLTSLTLVLLGFLTTLGSAEKRTINSKKIVDSVNSDTQSTWKADTYGSDSIDADTFIKSRLGLKLDMKKIKDINPLTNFNPFFTGPKKSNTRKVGGVPYMDKAYDARQYYSQCRSIGLIRNQANCGSCWAVSAASVFSDRLCILSNGKYNFTLSGHFTTACDANNYGCKGGYLEDVWDFYSRVGCITGGEFQSDEGCQDYGIRPCGAFPRKYPCSTPLALTPKCMKTKCSNEWYEYTEEKNIFKVKDYYQVGDTYFTLFNEFLIMDEILTNGPVQAGFIIYDDFPTYKSGIYRHKGSFWKGILGGHAVKITGWGEEKGIKYWLATNSWGKEWGAKGTFRIVRGKPFQNGFFESMVYAGIPDI